jgi:hypothetical protein
MNKKITKNVPSIGNVEFTANPTVIIDLENKNAVIKDNNSVYLSCDEINFNESLYSRLDAIKIGHWLENHYSQLESEFCKSKFIERKTLEIFSINFGSIEYFQLKKLLTCTDKFVEVPVSYLQDTWKFLDIRQQNIFIKYINS